MYIGKNCNLIVEPHGFDVSRENPEIVTKIQEMASQHISDIDEVENQLEKIGERD